MWKLVHSLQNKTVKFLEVFTTFMKQRGFLYANKLGWRKRLIEKKNAFICRLQQYDCKKSIEKSSDYYRNTIRVP